jgi:hypothetical protein
MYVQVVLPYLKSKLYSIYNKEREARLQASLWGHGDERFDDTDYIDGREDSLVSRGNLDIEASIRTRLTKRIHKILGACYPWLHASSEGMHMFQFSSGLYLQSNSVCLVSFFGGGLVEEGIDAEF